ncbi:DUF2924 domain-containing protein [Methylobacterium sp. J-048]|uniref:DUF2924 domain-containing protein n=1 Tax=Methylobacterium sp. J-048 TaxID=2836635 RepID=UPI001FBAD01B|nr:DUF2924 domain-containing protein [Methylobacterium sp. J-048]MCJ2061052.1 DUF2924 domain-containing protein [Methylobacterium sp. J-048]
MGAERTPAAAQKGRAGGGTRAAHTADRLAAALDELAGLDAAGLARRWRRDFGSAAPPGLSPALCARILAHRLQVRALGDLDRDTAQVLGRFAAGQGTGAGRIRSRYGAAATPTVIAVPMPDRRGQTPGVQLSREWSGRMHTVTVLDAGYAWDGATYPSLSRVAHAITGTKWNGPRFFGLRERAEAATGAGRERGERRAPA